jgi:hypothetical protein
MKSAVEFEDDMIIKLSLGGKPVREGFVLFMSF